jgi:hypothetical protein
VSIASRKAQVRSRPDRQRREDLPWAWVSDEQKGIAGMIASFEHGFIFIKTRKTAGTAIELVLSSLCGEADIITPIHPDDEKIRQAHGWRGPQNFRIGPASASDHEGVLERGDEADYQEMMKGHPTGDEYYNHMPASLARRMLGEAFWQKAHKWTIERHPYEKAVSQAYFKMWFMGRPAGDFQPVLDALIAGEEIDNRDLYTIDGKVALDEIIRQEDLPASFNAVLAKSGLRFDGALPRAKTVQRADRRPAAEILTDRQKKAIYDSCRQTFELMGYER